MAKINISFDNTNYSIDESSLASASATLKSHLKAVMNGSGAVINLGGNVYDVDSAKLTAATNAFITYLGTVAGSGKKVVINGVEYGIDFAKMASAVTELHTVLGGMHFDDEGGNQMPEKNEYGFYYNVPYVGDTSTGSAFVFYDDGTLGEFKGTKKLIRVTSDELVTSKTLTSTYTCNSLTATSSSGAIFAFDENGESFVYNDIVYTMTGVEHGVYFGDSYTNSDYGTYVFYSDGTIRHTDVDGTITDTVVSEWTAKQHCTGNYFFSLDGDTLFLGTKIFTHYPSIDGGSDDNLTVLDEAILEDTILD